jgi:broad specificity phosphatase PhoE
MSKTIEVYRHSIRTKPGQHLSQQGVTLARLVGENLGPFDRVVTSAVPRAFETAIAMGFAVDEQVELVATYGQAIEDMLPWPQPFIAYQAMINHPALADYLPRLADFYADLADHLADGCAALVINHGGIVEMSAVACLPEADYRSFGPHCECCEGVRLFWDDGRFISAEVLRIQQ